MEDGIIINNNYKALSELLDNCKTKEQVDLVFQWGSENYQTGYYFNRQVENFRESARYLKKVEEINNGGENKLIIGDNYDALNNLIAGGYKGKIDIIYIDPPYGMDNEGEFAKTNYENKVDRDALLSQLEPRLELARQLLNDNGVIFCSIDDRNQAHLKLLFDRIFGEINFLFCIPRQTKKGGKSSSTISLNNDYVLAYRKGNLIEFSKLEMTNIDKFNNEDKYVNERGRYALTQTLDYNSLQWNKEMDYPLEFNGKIFYAGGSKELYEKRKNGEHRTTDWVWRWSKKAVEWGIKNDWLVLKGNRIYTKSYLNCKKINGKCESVYVKPEKNYTTLTFIENRFSNDNAKKELTSIFSEKDVFKNPKPTSLVSELCKMVGIGIDGIVLDFYAGSGTTGQAVLELNKEDNGKRKFILCVNESGNSDEICKERVRRVMTGKTKEGKSDFEWIKKNKPLGSSLNIYKIQEASIHTDENCLIDKIDEADYDLPKFKTAIQKIEWICDNFKVCSKGLK